MAEMVSFKSNGRIAAGYLAVPETGWGSGVILVHDWWGLDPDTKAVADRLAQNGFVCLAPDLYQGELAGYDDQAKAEELMRGAPPDRVARDLSGAVDFLADHEAVAGESLGVIGFSIGGMHALRAANDRPDRIKVAVSFYGYPYAEMEPEDWSGLSASVHVHAAEFDDFFPQDGALSLEHKLQAMGKDVSVVIHPNIEHGFMSPHSIFESYDEQLAETIIWPQVILFMLSKLA